MRLACVHWPYAEPVGAAIRRVAQAGFEAIVIDGDMALDIATTRAELHASGVACAGGIAQMLEGRDLISADPEVRRITQDYMLATVRQTAELGGHYVCVVPGGDAIVVPRAEPADEWAWAVEGLSGVAREARELGMRLGIEPLNRYETNFINRVDQAIAIAREVGDDAGVIVDTFHMLLEESDPFAAATAAAPWLIDFQVADTNRRRPGAGIYDWPRWMHTLRSIGYNGDLTAEFVISADRTPASTFQLSYSPQHELAYGHHVPSDVLTAEMTEAARFLRALVIGGPYAAS